MRNNYCRSSKIQKLTKSFKNLTMVDDEILNDLYGKLNDIINTSLTWVKRCLILRVVVRQIFRSFPDRF